MDLFEIERNDVVSICLPNLPPEYASKEFDVPIALLKTFFQSCLPENNSTNSIEKWSEQLRQFALSICPKGEKNNNLFLTALSVLVFAYFEVFPFVCFYANYFFAQKLFLVN